MIPTPPTHTERAGSRPEVVIVGGGITGLSAAWALQQSAGSALGLTLVEQSGRWGGKVQTETFDVPGAGRFIVDAGPESFVTRKPEAWDLAHALGLQDGLLIPESETRGMHVLWQGRPVPVPLNPLAFVSSPLLGVRGKLRLLAEPFVPARQSAGDESIASFVERRLGREALQRFVGPILAGIYNADPAQQSLLATVPVMRDLEVEHGSLVRGALARVRRAPRGQPPRPRFFSFAAGAQVLVEALAARLTGRLLLNTAVEQIVEQAGRYRLVLAGGEALLADAVILATPANVAARLLGLAAPQAAALLGQVRHNGIGTLSLVVRTADLPAGFKVRGLMVPRGAGCAIDAVTFTSAKLPLRAAERHALLRVFFGANAPQLLAHGDAVLLAVAQRELKKLLGLTAPVLDYRAFRWPESFPQAAVGHLDLLAEVTANLPARLLLAGSAYHGVGVPDCIRQGQAAARRVVELLPVPVLG